VEYGLPTVAGRHDGWKSTKKKSIKNCTLLEWLEIQLFFIDVNAYYASWRKRREHFYILKVGRRNKTGTLYRCVWVYNIMTIPMFTLHV